MGLNSALAICICVDPYTLCKVRFTSHIFTLMKMEGKMLQLSRVSPLQIQHYVKKFAKFLLLLKKWFSQNFCLLQIYSQYVEVSDSLQQEKDENIRLKQYLDQILKVPVYY